MWSSAGDGKPASTEAETSGSFKPVRFSKGGAEMRDMQYVAIII